MASDRETLALEKIADGIVGSMFVIGELGVGPDLIRGSLVRSPNRKYCEYWN